MEIDSLDVLKKIQISHGGLSNLLKEAVGVA